ncbi:MAG TPA: UDP-glucose/GDP-mannose dehydrogenase family protein [Candidatus Limnocylindria bacterium]|nr:UDP-glucose/GDP-mannose dehydrogenase family protein [Candidatus Limnocylindria bacterium]
MRISVIGAGYVGAVSAAVLASLGNRVTCVEHDAQRLAAWRACIDPLGEPGLGDLLGRVDVRFAPEDDGLRDSDVVLIAVGTPMGADGRPDLEQLETAAMQIGARARRGAVVLVRSTVPVGTCERLQRGPLREQLVVSNPEFLREGHALRDAFYPDRIVAGGPSDARPVVEELYRRVIHRDGLPCDPARDERPSGPVPFCWMSAASAELAKYAANGFLATKLSFANEIANLAQAVGADAAAILGSMGLDPRIGSQFLRPGLGWGGSCFPKDTRALQTIADGMGYDFLVLKAAIDQNSRQLRGFASAIERALPRGATIGLLGLAFKAGTADTRESPAIALARLLVQAGLVVRAYDPAVRDLAAGSGIETRASVADACRDADAVVIATEWPEFAEVDLSTLRRLTRGDLLFDGRSVIAPSVAAAAGFRYAGPAGFVADAMRTAAARAPRLGTAA